MPSIVKSSKWFVRITAPWSHIEAKVTELRQSIDFESMMVGYHHGDKKGAPHAHICIIFKVERQKQSIDVRFKKLFEVEKSNYSSKPWDGDKKAMSYLYHDEKGRVDNFMNLDEKEIEELKDLNTQIQKVVQANKARASNRVVDYVIQMAIEGADGNSAVFRTWDRRRIGTVILEAVAEGKFYDPGDFQLEKYLNEIELKLALMSGDRMALRDTIECRLNRLASFR